MTGERSICSGRLTGKSKPLSESITFAPKDDSRRCGLVYLTPRRASACLPNANHLFLSYSSPDRDKVRAVHRYLSERGITTFFDQQNLRAGQNWPQALEQALRDSSAVAVFVGAQIGNWRPR